MDTRRVAVLLNPSSGPKRSGVQAGEIEAVFDAVGLRPDIIPLTGEVDARKEIADRVRMRFECVVAAGGDGTVSTVGSVLAGTPTALGVLPTGTLNHFARDLQLPMDLAAAAKVIADGNTAEVDVAEVNGHVFLNNSSIGFYPTLVTERERRIQAGWSKTLALLPAVMRAMWRFPNTSVRLLTDEAGLSIRTPFVFVGNNRYEFAGLQAGKRAKLSGGSLHLCVIDGTSRTILVKSVLLAIAGKTDAAAALITLDSKWAKISTLRRHVRVALDGEVVRLDSPLVYSIRPAALKVLVPREPVETAEDR